MIHSGSKMGREDVWVLGDLVNVGILCGGFDGRRGDASGLIRDRGGSLKRKLGKIRFVCGLFIARKIVPFYSWGIVMDYLGLEKRRDLLWSWWMLMILWLGFILVVRDVEENDIYY